MICSTHQHFIMEGGRTYQDPTLCWLLHLDLAPFWFYTSFKGIWWFVWVLHLLVLLLISNFSVQLLPQLGFIAMTKILTKRKSGKKWFIWLIAYCPLMCMIVMRMYYGDLLHWRVHLDLLTYPYEEHPDHSLPNGKRKPTANRNCSKMFLVSHHFLRALLKYDLLSFIPFLPLFTNKIHLSV